jgi:hypothetical protein
MGNIRTIYPGPAHWVNDNRLLRSLFGTQNPGSMQKMKS